MRRLLGLSSLAGAIALAAGAPGHAGGAPCGLAGAFRIYSSALVYASGGSGVMTPGYEQMQLTGNRWSFGTSKGTFSVAPITPADWKRWGAKPYGPTTKMVLSGWNHGTADGPIEAASHAVNFFWVIYPVAPPVTSARGTAELKFGHVVVPKTCP